MTAIRAWTGTYGDYLIPAEFRDIKINKSGFPDLRHKRAKDLLNWVDAQEKAAASKVDANRGYRG